MYHSLFIHLPTERHPSCFQVLAITNKAAIETSLVVQWLRLHAPNAGGLGSIPGQGTKIPHTATKPTRHNY